MTPPFSAGGRLDAERGNADASAVLNYRHLFSPADDPKLVETVVQNLELGAAKVRGIPPEDYIHKCREIWSSCETDEVFKMKLLVDRLVKNSHPALELPADWSVEEDVSPKDDLRCVAIGLVRPDGTYLEAPEGYDDKPKNPKSNRAVLVALPSELPGDEPAHATPAPYMVALFDVLGFSDRLRDIGLERMLSLYDSLIEVAIKPNVADRLWTPSLHPIGPGEIVVGMFYLPVRHAYFSDTLLLWVPYDARLVAPFFTRLLDTYCEALRLGLPLRGAVSVGTCVLHKGSSKYLGEPLVEAARLHDSQDWIGVACGVSFRSETLRVPVNPFQVMLYDPPLKKESDSALLSGLVLDWPRRWREVHGSSGAEAIERLRSPRHGKYYDAAVKFVLHSAANEEWFVPDGYEATHVFGYLPLVGKAGSASDGRTADTSGGHLDQASTSGTPPEQKAPDC